MARARDIDLKSYGQEHLFSPINAEVDDVWKKDRDGYYFPNIHSTARKIAKFGLFCLNDGKYEANQIIAADWVHDSLQTYWENA